ncbi:Biotin synthase [hydrothermal vent metagenome]|uniref:biotin synthase n=1 Tax=hydrothermal vent metagenome TaxID=652676 RepID=A0A1W1BQG4_9ZZZZ
MEKQAQGVFDLIYLCAISNIRSGVCREDCKFCTQSVKWGADIKRYKEKKIEDIVNEAKLARKNKAAGFCLVTSGKSLDDKTLEYVAKVTKAILKEVDIKIIACNGTASKEALRELKKSGVSIYNHNLETSREFYPKICTTHSWDERFSTCENVKSVGLRLCSGGIFGMGESEEDRISLLNSLKKLNPDGIPLNFFIENNKLPLKATHNKQMALNIIKIFRKNFENAIIMLAGGRELVFKDKWIEAIKAGANSIVIGDYLTTKGERPDKDIEILRKEGFEIANEC